MSDVQRDRNIARYVVMSLVFDSDGWKEIVRELEEELENISQALLYASTDTEIFRLQGRAHQIAVFISLPQVVEQALLQLREEE